MKKSWIILSFLIFASVSGFSQPEGISNLTALSTGTEGRIDLQWTVPDTGIALSTPTAYLVKYATSQINNSDIYAAWTSTAAQSWTNLLSSGTVESRTLTGLVPGATLYFAMVAVDSDTVYGVWFSSDDTAGAVNNANFACVLDSSPVQIAGVNVSVSIVDRAFNIYWTAGTNTDINQYRIERSSYSTAPASFGLLTNILYPGTTHQDNLDIVNGNTYYYRVHAEDNTGNTGQFSIQVSTSINVRAPVFSSSSIPVSTTTINWAWSPLLTDATGYRIILSSSSDIVAEFPASTTFWQQSWLTPDTTASIMVQAYNGQLSSNSVASSAIYTWANPPSGIFSPLQPGTTSIDLQWQPNGNPWYTRYNIERSTRSGSNFDQIVTLLVNTTHHDNGLPGALLREKTTYYYNIWAMNSAATPVATAKVQLSTMTASNNPQAPTFSSAKTYVGTAKNGDVYLQWSAPSDDDTSEKVTAYVIKKATFQFTDAEFNIPSVSTVTQNITPATYQSGEELLVTGLYPGATFYFGMKARDEAGNLSALSIVRSTASRDDIPPAPPLISAYAISETSVVINWSHPSISGYDDRAFYMVYRATFNFTLTSQATYSIQVSTFSPGTSYTDNAGGGTNYLRKETTYYYMLTTRDLGDGPAGSGLTGAVLESTPTVISAIYMPDLTAPYAITNFIASTGITEGRVDLVWSTPPDDYDTQAGGISGGVFRLAWNDTGIALTTDSPHIDISTTTAAGTSNYYTVSGLTDLGSGVTYYFSIWTADEAGNWSAISIPATAWAQIDVTPPDPVTGLNATAFWRGVNLAWTVPGDDGYVKNINSGHFQVTYSSYIDFTSSTTVTVDGFSALQGVTTNYTVLGLSNTTMYYFSVKTADELMNWSDVSVDTPAAGPQNNTPGAFTLNLPVDGSISATAQPVLQWFGSIDDDSVYGDTVTYRVFYSTDMNFSANTTTATSAMGTGLSYPIPAALPEDMTIFWTVRASDQDNAYNWSTSTFSVMINAVNSAPAVFALVEPNAVSTNTATPRLSWDPSSDVDPGASISYRVDYSLYPDFTPYVSSAGITGTQYVTPALTENMTYYWRVWASDGLLSAMSNTTYYVVIDALAEAPNAFNITAPPDNTRQFSLGATFYWEPTIDPDPGNTVSYNLSYSQVLSFASSETVTGLSSTSAVVELPLDNFKYYWRVDALGSDNQIRQSNQTLMTYTDLYKEVPQTFILNEPGYGVIISTTLKPLFSWNTATDPDPADIVRYYVEISIDPTFTGSQPIPTGTDTFYQPLSDLLDQSTYYWKVRASGFQGSPVPAQVDPGFVFSATGTFTFSMINNPPQAFSLTSPENGATISTKRPTLTWAVSTDSDLNDSITYTVVVSSVSDFSVTTLQEAGLTDTNYVITSPLSENRTYYWKVVSKDKKGLEKLCSAVFSFTVPVINRPASPAGLRGSISADELTFSLNWSAVTRNSDGTVLNDLAGYNIYRSLSIQTAGTGAPFAQTAAGTLSFVDGSVQGGKYYYLVRAIDASGIEGANSLLIESLNPDKMSLVSLDQQIMAELPSEVSKELLAENNRWNTNLAVEFSRKTSEEIGRTLRVYDLTVRDSDFNELSDYSFATPVTLQFSYNGLALAPDLRGGGSRAQSFAAGELSVYWFNGVEFIRVGGYMDDVKKRVSIRVTKPGQYQLRQIVKASAFGVASLNPAKVFTPGVAPYEKMTFYIDNPSGDKVTGKIYDLRGEFIADIKVLGDATATTVTMEWDGNGTRKGVYIYQVEGDERVVNGTIILAR